MVVFEDGLARKSEYRRFVIKGVDGQNDVASMHEVITRRFRRLLDEQARSRAQVGRPTAARCWSTPRPAGRGSSPTRPGLVVVDGGPPQVAAAQRALDELGIDDIPVCGLAKRLEEVWLPGQEDPVILARSSRGALPAPAGPRRGPPLRDHPPPLPPLQDDGGEPARRRARARRGAAQDPAQALRLAEEAAGRDRRRDRPGSRHRAAHRDRDQGRGRRGRLERQDWPGITSINTATGEIEES